MNRGAAFLKTGAAPPKSRWEKMRTEKLINSGIPVFCGILLFIMVLLTFLQIVLRNFFDTGIAWSDDVSQFSMSWMALLGSIWLTKNGKHLNTGLKIHRNLNKRQVGLIDNLLSLVIVGVAAVMTYQTTITSLTAMRVESIALPWLKMGYVYIALPLFMVAVCFYYLKNFIQNLALIFKRD
jgi:TRAP-type C4-dicarboxylate transport system permease small subunit